MRRGCLRQTIQVSSSADVGVRNIQGIDDPALEAVVSLGDANRSTLGFLPRAGFLEAARSNSIIIAVNDEGVQGYCLFGRTAQFLRIVHLCVAGSHRGSGTARRLVEQVEALGEGLAGIRLKCRRDWPAAGLWPRLGFRAMSEVPGRSKRGSLLTIWWKSLAPSEDLFTLSAELEGEPLAVSMDSNVFSDLHCGDDDDRRQFAAPVALLSGDQQIQLLLPHCAVGEVNRALDTSRRRRLLAAQHTYRILDHSASAGEIRSQLLAGISQSELQADPSLQADAWLVAESVAAGCDVFLTRDENALRLFGPLALDLSGLAVMLPSELTDHVRRRHASADYRPANLAETGIVTVREVASRWSVAGLDTLLNREAGERKAAWRAILRETAGAAGQGVLVRSLAVAPDGQVAAAWARSRELSPEMDLRVPLLRVGSGSFDKTLARQILFSLRTDAVALGARGVVLDDPAPSNAVRQVLPAEGFIPTDGPSGQWCCIVLDACAPWGSLRGSPHLDGLVCQVDEMPGPVAAADLERRFWPLKISDAGLINYLVPIRGPFADDLLGHAPTLVPRDLTLGLSREHVYYRAPRSHPQAPARILWYSSGRDRQVVACSSLLEAFIGEPDSVHREFKRLGVWTRAQVRGAANGGKVGVLRFADTHVFDHPVSLDWMRSLSVEAATLPGQGPRQISGPLFEMIYVKGRHG